MTINDPNWLAAYKSLALPEDANDADHVAADRDGRVYLYPVALSVVGGYWRQGLCQTGDVTPSSDWEGSLCTVGAIRAYEPPKQVRLRVDMQTGEVRIAPLAGAWIETNDQPYGWAAQCYRAPRGRVD